MGWGADPVADTGLGEGRAHGFDDGNRQGWTEANRWVGRQEKVIEVDGGQAQRTQCRVAVLVRAGVDGVVGVEMGTTAKLSLERVEALVKVGL